MMTVILFLFVLPSLGLIMGAIYFYLRARTEVGLKLPNKVDPSAWRPDVLDEYVWNDMFSPRVRRDYLRYLALGTLACASLGGLAVISTEWSFAIALGLLFLLGATRLLILWHRHKDKL
jgi:hypothetical protein